MRCAAFWTMPRDTRTSKAVDRPRRLLLAIVAASMVNHAHASPVRAIDLEIDRQQLAGDLLLVTTSAQPPLADMAPAANAAYEFLIDTPEGAPVRLRLSRVNDAGWLQSGTDGETRIHRTTAGLAALLERVADLDSRKARADTDPVETTELVAAFSIAAGRIGEMFAADMAAPPLGGAGHGGYTWFESGGLLFVSGSDDAHAKRKRPKNLVVFLVELEVFGVGGDYRRRFRHSRLQTRARVPPERSTLQRQAGLRAEL